MLTCASDASVSRSALRQRLVAKQQCYPLGSECIRSPFVCTVISIASSYEAMIWLMIGKLDRRRRGERCGRQ